MLATNEYLIIGGTCSSPATNAIAYTTDGFTWANLDTSDIGLFIAGYGSGFGRGLQFVDDKIFLMGSVEATAPYTIGFLT